MTTKGKATYKASLDDARCQKNIQEVKQFLIVNAIKYDADKFVEEIEDVETLQILDNMDAFKDIFPDMALADVHKILKAVKKMIIHRERGILDQCECTFVLMKRTYPYEPSRSSSSSLSRFGARLEPAC